jgi:hypothetical protein
VRAVLESQPQDGFCESCSRTDAIRTSLRLRTTPRDFDGDVPEEMLRDQVHKFLDCRDVGPHFDSWRIFAVRTLARFVSADDALVFWRVWRDDHERDTWPMRLLDVDLQIAVFREENGFVPGEDMSADVEEHLTGETPEDTLDETVDALEHAVDELMEYARREDERLECEEHVRLARQRQERVEHLANGKIIQRTLHYGPIIRSSPCTK